MTSLIQLSESAAESQIAEWLQLSQGRWRSERRYYALPDGEIQEVVTFLTIRFLEPGTPELVQLVKMHQIEQQTLTCGAIVSWDSTHAVSGRQQSAGSTLFGVLGNIMYRDRGFATKNPVQARFYMPETHTLCLRTEYNGSVFEEEIKQIGCNYRTRQTIVSRAGEQLMIGQYLEKRIH